MADDADVASDNVAEDERRRIEKVRRDAQKPIPESPTCLWCSTPTVGGARWCSASCRDDWQKYGERCSEA